MLALYHNAHLSNSPLFASLYNCNGIIRKNVLSILCTRVGEGRSKAQERGFLVKMGLGRQKGEPELLEDAFITPLWNSNQYGFKQIDPQARVIFLINPV